MPKLTIVTEEKVNDNNREELRAIATTSKGKLSIIEEVPVKKNESLQPATASAKSISSASANGGVNTPQSKSQLPLQPKEQTYDGLLGQAIQKGNDMGVNSPADTPLSITPQDEPFDIIGQSLQSKKDEKANKMVAGHGDAYFEAPDNDTRNKAQAAKKKIKDLGYDADKLNEAFSDFPQELLKTDEYNKDKLLKLYKDNPILFQQSVASAKWQSSLVKSIVAGKNSGDKRFQDSMDEWQALRNMQNTPKMDYEATRQHARNAKDLIYKYINDPEEQQKALANLASDMATSYGIGTKGTTEALEKDQRKEFLNKNELLGLQFIEDTDPTQASTFNNILIGDDKLDKVDGFSIDRGEILGKQQQKAKLAEIGIGLKMKAVSKKMDELQAKANDGTPLTDDEVAKYNGYLADYNSGSAELKAMADPNNKEYGKYAQHKLDDIAQEAFGQKFGFFANQGFKAINGIGNTVSSAYGGIADLFRTDDEKKQANLQRIGNNIKYKSDEYVTDISGKNILMSPKLIYDRYKITSDPNLSDDEKLEKGKKLLADNPDEWEMNIGDSKTTPKSVIYKLADTLNGLGQFVLTSTVLRGAGVVGKANIATSTILNGYAKEAAENLENNEPAPLAKAFASNVVGGFLFAAVDQVGVLKKMFAPSTPIGQAIDKLSNDELKAIIAQSNKKNILTNIIEATGSSFKHTLPMTAAGVGHSIARDAINDNLRTVDEYLAEGAETQAIFTLFGIPMGTLNKYKENVITKKDATSELAKRNPLEVEVDDAEPLKSTTVIMPKSVGVAKELESLVTQLPISELRRPNGSIGTQGFTEENLVSVARHIADDMGFEIPAFDESKGTSEVRQVIEYLKGNKEAQQKIKEYVVKDPVLVNKMPDDTYSIEDGNHRANLLNLIGVKELPTIELNGRDKALVMNEHNKVVSDLLGKNKEEVSIPSEGEIEGVKVEAPKSEVVSDVSKGVVNKTGKEKDLAGTEHAIATFNKGAFYPKETKVSEKKNAVFQRDNNGQLEVYHLEKYETENGLQRFVLVKEGKEKPIAGIIVNSKNEIIQARSDKQGLGTKLGELVKNEIPNLSASGDISNQGLKFLERLDIKVKENETKNIKESDIQTNEGSPTSNESLAPKTQSNPTAEVDKTKPTASEGAGEKEPPKPPIEDKPLIENKDDSNEFDKLTHTTIESNEVRETLSNTERVTGIELDEATKLYNKQSQNEAFAWGENVITAAKEKFGNEYVPKLLEYLKQNRGTLSIENHALISLSLEVDLTKQHKADLSNLSIKKQLYLVRAEVASSRRSGARAQGYGILRDIALNGYSARKEMSNQLLTAKEREVKNKIEEALHADAETIQKEAESKLQEKEDTITLTAAELEAKVTEAAAKLRIEERKVERVEKKEKVHKAIDDFTEKWIAKLSVKGAKNLKAQGADIRTVMMAAAKAMKKAYDLGLETKEAVQQAVDYISDKLGTNEWDKEAYKKEAAAQLGLEYKNKGKESQFKQEYKALETERNRQLAVVDKLQTELTDLQKGIRKTPESKEVVKDTPEIEALKLKIKEEKAKLAVTDATIKRIAVKETELQRLQERKPQVKTERDKRILSEREVELQKQIDAEKKAIKEETIANGGGRLDKAKERVKLRMEEIREEIAAKERKAKEEGKPLNGDLEYDRLLEQEAALKKLRDKYLPEENDPFEKEKQREQVKDALVKDIVDLNEQINARERAPKKEKADYSNDEEIVKLKKLKADKQAILEEIDPAAVPKEKTITEKIKQSENNLQSQIDAIQKEIANGERELKSAKKNPLQSKKLDQLREQKKSLEALRDKYLPKTNDPFEQQKAEKAARTNLTKEVIELNRQIQKGQKDILTETKSPESENLEKLMQEKRARQAILEALDPTPKLFVEQALIEKGFGKKVKVKTKTGVEERNVLDWTKLTGEERNIENISRNIGEVLQDKGFTEEQGLRIQDKFIDEYNRLSADVLEKSQNRLAALNNKLVTSEQRSAGQKLAELYNLGLFEKDPAQLEYLLSRAIGTSEITLDRFKAIGEIAKTFALIHKQKFNGRDLLGISKGTVEKILEDLVQLQLNAQKNDKGNWALIWADTLKWAIELSQRIGLNSLINTAQNIGSNLQTTVMSNISGFTTAGKIPKEIIDRTNNARRAILKDMIVNGEVNFGSSGTAFTNRSNVDAKLKTMTDSQVYHTIASFWTGKAALDGIDSYFKVKMTNMKLYQHTFKVLTSKRVVDGKTVEPMTKVDAQRFLVEKLTGQSFDAAVTTAREFIKKANAESGKVVIKDNPLMVERLANDIVKTALVQEGVISEEMITAAYKSALGLSELNLGQKPNNLLSRGLSSTSGALEKSYNDAIKSKHYNNAALIQVASSFYKAANKYMVGKTNWAVIGLENGGVGLLSHVYNSRERVDFDLTSDAGIASLEKAFLYEGKRRDAFVRGAVGAATSAVITGLVASTVGIDETRRWRAKNPFLARLSDPFTPLWITGTIAWKNSVEGKKGVDGVPEFVQDIVGMSGRFEKAPRLVESMKDLAKGKGDKFGQIAGEVIGSNFEYPIPYKWVKDVDNTIRAVKGEKIYKVPKTPKSEQGFMNGVSKGGSIDYFKSLINKK